MNCRVFLRSSNLTLHKYDEKISVDLAVTRSAYLVSGLGG